MRSWTRSSDGSGQNARADPARARRPDPEARNATTLIRAVEWTRFLHGGSVGANRITGLPEADYVLMWVAMRVASMPISRSIPAGDTYMPQK